MKIIFPSIDKYVAEDDKPIKPNEYSRSINYRNNDLKQN